MLQDSKGSFTFGESKRGGKRPNAGRKKKEPTTTMRVLVWMKPMIEEFIMAKKLQRKYLIKP